ncbi:hypothetical protein HBH98_094460 [Parastagonospora nodorum]|nr:hypothetical protein HBH54_190400 [Parastagonospora nodorum]KAH4150331.1 hypothetical protein HBH44_180870 [Parastagonospora nodorum]KAH4291176.1 hypothetical protein HBI01_192530 [Parastagonospora nodorum]KAH4347520.1 hypothetical protein HBH98_094460 [Parastagonospora nodorum]KAH4359354.1 hypothetical protein HBH94_202350 [Parastagonospora nodorum]
MNHDPKSEIRHELLFAMDQRSKLGVEISTIEEPAGLNVIISMDLEVGQHAARQGHPSAEEVFGEHITQFARMNHCEVWILLAEMLDEFDSKDLVDDPGE